MQRMVCKNVILKAKNKISPENLYFSYFLRNLEASTVCLPSSSSESESEDVELVSQASESSESSESSSSSLKEKKIRRKTMGRLTGVISALPADPCSKDS